MDELFSIEVFVRKLYSLDAPCHLPSLSFRLLDFPAQTIHITSSERIAKIQDKISVCPEYLSELGKLKNSNGDIVFNKGKSCLFPLSFESAQSQLSEIPLFIVLTDEVGKQPKYLGSIGISLVKLMDSLRDKTKNDATSICNEALRGSYPIKNLMGSRVAKLAVEVKLFYYGKNLVHHIPALNKVAEKVHESPLGTSEHLVSDEAVISVMEDIVRIPSSDEAAISVMEDIVQRPSSNDAEDATPELHTPESVDSDKDKDESDLNPPPLFYQAPLCRNETSRDNEQMHESFKERDPSISTYKEASPKQKYYKSNEVSRVDKPPTNSPVKSSPSQQGSDVDILNRGYDPKKFDLIRAVLTELTYLTDFLDPKLGQSNDNTPCGSPNEVRGKQAFPKPPQEQRNSVSSKKRQKLKSSGRYGLTNSYILRLSRLGPEKALEVLSKHLDTQSVSSIMEKLFVTPSRTVIKPSVKKNKKPTLVNTESQTDTMPSPRVVWQDQSPNSSKRKIGNPSDSADPLERLSGTAPFTVTHGGQTIDTNPLQSTNSSTMAQVLAAMQALANTGISVDGEERIMSPNRDTRKISPNRCTRTISPNRGTRIMSPNRSTRIVSPNRGTRIISPNRGTRIMSPNRDMPQDREVQSRLSRHSSLRRANSNQEYVYSDNFEEPSCVSLTAASPTSRPLSSRGAHSKLSMRDLVVEEEYSDVPELQRKPVTMSRRSSRNTRYEKRSNSMKSVSTTRDHEDSSSTTSTAGSTTNISPRRFRDSSCSKKSQTSLGSNSTTAILQRSNSCSSARSTSIACQTPALSRSHSTQTNPVSESDDGESVMTVLPSPTRDIPPSPAPEVPSEHASPTTRDAASDHAISSHSSLESGSIYIGSDTDVEEEEDPLQLSYLLSTESVQFSDEDQPTSLLKLCSPSEARAVNKFMYTF